MATVIPDARQESKPLAEHITPVTGFRRSSRNWDPPSIGSMFLQVRNPADGAHSKFANF